MALKQLLQENHSVLLNATATDWRSAIQLGTDLLERSQAIEPSYFHAICDLIVQKGPYMIMAPSFMLPHARPEQGVNRTAFALVTLATPIQFDGDETPVSLLITLAAHSAEAHLDGLMEVMQLLEDPNDPSEMSLEPLLACTTPDDLYALIDARCSG